MSHTPDHSLQLLHKALAINPNQAFWCKQLQVSRTTFAVALIRGYLTPMVAAELARFLNEDIEHWATIALLDSQPQSYKVNKLRGIVTSKSQQRHTYTAS